MNIITADYTLDCRGLSCPMRALKNEGTIEFGELQLELLHKLDNRLISIWDMFLNETNFLPQCVIFFLTLVKRECYGYFAVKTSIRSCIS